MGFTDIVLLDASDQVMEKPKLGEIKDSPEATRPLRGKARRDVFGLTPEGTRSRLIRKWEGKNQSVQVPCLGARP